MPGTDLSSIPLPSEGELERPPQKLTAKEILEKALKEHKSSTRKGSSKSSASAPSAIAKKTNDQPETPATKGQGQNSQRIVDELFKDFISKKMSKTVKTISEQETGTSSSENKGLSSINEMSKLLDMEISSIQAQTTKDASTVLRNVTVDNHDADKIQTVASVKEKLEGKDTDPGGSSSQVTSKSTPRDVSISSISSSLVKKSFSLSSSVMSTSSSGSVNHLETQKTDENKIKTDPPNCINPEAAHTSKEHGAAELSSHQNKTMTNPTSVSSNKIGVPKQLGCKLSLESLSLIQSNDKIDRNGRLWEEGEVPSSHSENSGKEDEESETDGVDNISDTGSIVSTNEEGTSKQHHSSKHKKKHKHKHKKKKKKSGKEKDRSKKKSSDGDRKKESSREKGKGKEDDDDKKEETSPGERSRKNSSRSEHGVEKHPVDDSISSKEKEKSKSHGGSSKEDDGKRADKSKKRKRDRSRSPKHRKRSRSRSRSRSPKKSRRDPSPKKPNTRSHFGEWDARHYGDDTSKPDKGRSRSRSKSPDSKKSSRKRSRSRDHDRDLRLRIDKAKLRKIAIANALNNMKSGSGQQQVDPVTIKSGGKSVEELTDFCKRISEKDRDNEVSDSSEEEPAVKSDDDELPIHHPFKVKDTTSNIVMNIRNSKQLPIMTPSEKQAQQASLRLAFPVSSGSHHRASESEWVPVERTKTVAATTTSKPVLAQSQAPPEPVVEKPKEESKSIFKEPKESKNIDIGSIISERLQAVRKLQQNPYDVQALNKMHKAQEKASQWATSKHLPGQFVGTTGAKVMSQQELFGDKHHQAWAKKSQFTSAAPISGGIGLLLLQKMGWKQGDGLGKNNEGTKVPLQLDFKIDRKGLSTPMENPKAKPQIVNTPRAKDLSNKHPVSALMELCNRRRWGAPAFTIVMEDGPDHKKNFLFKVKVNNVEYQPTVASSNKKSAKAMCAAVCLQEMGLIPRDAPMNY